MTPNNKQPIALVKAKGKSHKTKAEIEMREKLEVKVNLKDVSPPEYLPNDMIEEFNDLSSKLLTVGIMTELDEEALTRYLISKQQYYELTNDLSRKLKKKSKKFDDYVIIDKIQNQQDKAFKQVRMSASDLGLTISSRCKLILPPSDDPPKQNKFSKFGN